MLVSVAEPDAGERREAGVLIRFVRGECRQSKFCWLESVVLIITGLMS